MPEPAIGLKSKHNQAAAIVADLSLTEKARLCSGRNFWHLEGVERFDLPSVMVTDGPHGLRKQTRGAYRTLRQQGTVRRAFDQDYLRQVVPGGHSPATRQAPSRSEASSRSEAP